MGFNMPYVIKGLDFNFNLAQDKFTVGTFLSGIFLTFYIM